jgi:peptide deformylase
VVVVVDTALAVHPEVEKPPKKNYIVNAMALRDVLIFPDPVLRRESRPVEVFDERLGDLARDMIDTMLAKDGVGLAAPQVGENVRLITIDAHAKEERSRPIVLVNPEIVEKSGDIVWNEGCLSFPGIYEEIKRAEQVTVKARNLEGAEFTLKAEGLLAVALQHEIDHLEGILIFDYMSFLRKKLVRRELKKKVEEMKKEAEETGGLA